MHAPRFRKDVSRTLVTREVKCFQKYINTFYALQVVTNLATTNWVSQFSFQLSSSPFSITDSQATNQQRLYRLLKDQPSRGGKG